MSILDDYKKIICPGCKNRKTDLCEIKHTVDGSVRCIYYEKDKESFNKVNINY